MYNKDGAIIFLGPSGTGKTTICNLLSAYIDVLAEDAIYLVPQPAGRYGVLCGDKYAHTETPQQFFAKTNPGPGIPLRAIVRLYQAEKPYLRRIDAFLTCRYLTDAFYEVVRQRREPLDVKQRIFATLAEMARYLGGHEFHFTLSPHIPRIMNLELGLW
ncbi:MAG: hypothetical protein JXA21_17865 [Anaerolineae bacterium]|nr:hypothetical protein [Anaerolineae bacterium]